MIMSVDKTGSGKIDFNEFLELLLAKMVLAAARAAPPFPSPSHTHTACSRSRAAMA